MAGTAGLVDPESAKSSTACMPRVSASWEDGTLQYRKMTCDSNIETHKKPKFNTYTPQRFPRLSVAVPPIREGYNTVREYKVHFYGNTGLETMIVLTVRVGTRHSESRVTD